MPSLERLTDSLNVHVTDQLGSEYDKGFVRGYIQGKSFARIQVALIAIFSMIGWGVVFLLVT